MKANQRYFGVSTAREGSFVIRSSSTIDIPRNSNIIRYHGDDLTEIIDQQLHQDSITSIAILPDNPKITFSTSYGGEIKFWKNEYSETNPNAPFIDITKDKYVTGKPKLTFYRIRKCGGFLLTFCELEEESQTKVDLWKIVVGPNAEYVALENLYSDINSYEFGGFCEWAESFEGQCDVFFFSQSKAESSYEGKMVKCSFIMDSKSMNVISEYSIQADIGKVYQLSFSGNNHFSEQWVALLSQNGFLGIFDIEKFKMITIIDKCFPEKKTCVKYLSFFSPNKLMIAADNGLIAVWELLVDEKGDCYATFRNTLNIPYGPIYMMESFISDTGIILWVTTISSLHKFQLDWDLKNLFDERMVEFHSLTCSGISMCDQSDFVASIDFSGNLFVWKQSTQRSRDYLFKANIGDCLRTVNILRYDRTTFGCLVGTLGGELISLTLKYEEGVLIEKNRGIVARLKGSIINLTRSHSTKSKQAAIIKTKEEIISQAIQVDNSNLDSTCAEVLDSDTTASKIYSDANALLENDGLIDRSFEEEWTRDQDKIVVGTSEGYLALFHETSPGVFLTDFVIPSHLPMSDYEDDRFGSLKNYAEIWSVCFSPANDYIASASEDQTTCIWNLQGMKVHTFVGHATPVTSVDWVHLDYLDREMLITCADDKKVFVWALNEKNKKYKRKWILHSVFETTTFGLGWHTLTYLKVVGAQNFFKIFVSSQNGYLFCWDVNAKRLDFSHKVHHGSIEGLSAKAVKDEVCVATCSSDCTIGLHKFNRHETFN